MSSKYNLELNIDNSNPLYIEDIIDNKDYKKIFSNIEVKNNFTKKVSIREYKLYNTKGINFKIKKNLKRKKIKGICVDKIFDGKKNVIYYLYLINNGIFCVLKVPNGIININSIDILKVENPLKTFCFIDKDNNDIILNWNKERIIKNLEWSLKNMDKNNFNLRLFLKKFIKYLIKIIYK